MDEDAELRIGGVLDRIYLDAPSELRVRDDGNGRTFHLRASGFSDTVVWNPWAQGAASLPDMEDEEYREMICVEAAQVGTPVTLGAGERWTGEQRIQVEARA